MAENAVNTEQGVILEALNNKVDLNQLNTDNQGLSYISGLSMPSGKYIDLELGASGSTYTAPADGWVYFSGAVSGDQRVLLGVNNPIIYELRDWCPNNQYYQGIIPVKKGYIFTVIYTSISSYNYFRFYYAQGSESEE